MAANGLTARRTDDRVLATAAFRSWAEAAVRRLSRSVGGEPERFAPE